MLVVGVSLRFSPFLTVAVHYGSNEENSSREWQVKVLPGFAILTLSLVLLSPENLSRIPVFGCLHQKFLLRFTKEFSDILSVNLAAPRRNRCANK